LDMDRFRSGLAAAIRERRTKVLLGKAGLAAKLGVSEETVRLWCVGKVSPALERLPALAEALGVTTVELVRLACKMGGVK
jgi:ribosome-binding protein aMBF1 (putative translation factor)